MCAEALAPLIALHHSATRLANQQTVCGQSGSGGSSSVGHTGQKTSNTLCRCKLRRPVSCRHRFGINGVTTPTPQRVPREQVEIARFTKRMAVQFEDRARLGFFVLSVWTFVSSDLKRENLRSHHHFLSCIASLCVEFTSTIFFLLFFFFSCRWVGLFGWAACVFGGCMHLH